MNATPADQRRLLEVAELDARIRTGGRGAPQPAAGGAGARAPRSPAGAVARSSPRGWAPATTCARELARIESDVEMVDARRARDAERLATSSNTKEVQGLESELASLARRKSDLEDAELDLMERLEQADAAVAEQEALIAETNDEGARLSAEGKRVVAEATAAYDQAARDRAAVSATIPPTLLALYDRVAVRSSGAALLRRGTCEGCRMVLAGTDLQAHPPGGGRCDRHLPGVRVASWCARRNPACDPTVRRRGRWRLSRKPGHRRGRRGGARRGQPAELLSRGRRLHGHRHATTSPSTAA